MRIRSLAVGAALAMTASVATAQSAAEHIALGDQLHAEMKPAEALVHYEAAVKADSNSYEAQWKLSQAAADVAEFDTDKSKQGQLFSEAEKAARNAIRINPGDAEGHFYLARAVGRLALTKGVSERVKFAGIVHDEAEAALKANPNHPGALHALGLWNAEIMRLSGFQRFMAKNFLGGRVFNQANWDNARKNLEKAVEVDPSRLTHKLDLGNVYKDIGEKEKAKEQFEAVINGKATDYNDKFYKQKAEEALKALS
ncbi:MAG: hypothetical protein M3081_04895 [Gemmatimonadota bacterium]|nr:hypothetical protein [Gemmatimonadota bacterium]